MWFENNLSLFYLYGFMKLVVCFIYPRQRLGDKHTYRFVHTVWNEYFKFGYFRWGKNWQSCGQDISRGRNFRDLS